MGFQVKVLQKGKITIPAELRERLAIREGDTLVLEVNGARLVLFPPRTVQNPTDLLTGLVEGAVLGNVDDELRRAAASRVERKLSRARR